MPGLPPMCSLCQQHLEHALCGPGSSVLWSLLRGVRLLLGDGTDCVGAAPSPDILLLGRAAPVYVPAGGVWEILLGRLIKIALGILWKSRYDFNKVNKLPPKSRLGL